MTPRGEYIQWCKRRALEYVAAGDLVQALASMSSDMGKRTDTRIDPHFARTGMQHVLDRDAVGLRRWIEGFQ